MCIEVLFGYIQYKVQFSLSRQRCKTVISFFQYLSNITLDKVQAESLTLCFTEIQQLVRQT